MLAQDTLYQFEVLQNQDISNNIRTFPKCTIFQCDAAKAVMFHVSVEVEEQ